MPAELETTDEFSKRLVAQIDAEPLKKRARPAVDLYLDLQTEVRRMFDPLRSGQPVDHAAARIAAFAKMVADAQRRDTFRGDSGE